MAYVLMKYKSFNFKGLGIEISGSKSARNNSPINQSKDKTEPSSENNACSNCNTYITTDLYELDWKAIFDRASQFEGIFVYNRTWRGLVGDSLEKFAKKEGGSFTAYIPNRNNVNVISELARRFKMTNGDLIAWIDDAEDDFAKRFRNKSDCFSFDIIEIDITPTAHIYLTDCEAVVSHYTHRETRGNFLTVHELAKSETYAYARRELNSIKHKRN